MSDRSAAAALEALPNVPVFGRHVLSWPTQKPENPWLESYKTLSVPIDKALTALYDSDAHFVAYEADRRLNTQALGACPVKMVLFVVDVDAPNHVVPSAEWRQTERAKVARLRAIAPGFFAFETLHGYRLVWRLDEPQELTSAAEAALWSQIYRGWLAWLERETGIVGDEKCADWTRLYRLPFVRRDNEDQRLHFEGDLQTGAWEFKRGLELVQPANTNAYRVTDDTEGNAADPASVDPLIDAIIAELDAAGRWRDQRQDYFLSFLGWLLGHGWAVSELERLVERMPSKVGEYLRMVRRARPRGGPGKIKRLLTAEAFARLDAAVNAHPHAVARRAREAEFAAEMATANAQDVQREAPADGLSKAKPKTSSPLTPVSDSKPLATAAVVNILGGDLVPDWEGVIGYDALANRPVCLREPPMRPEDDPGVSCIGEWTDAHTARARTWIWYACGKEPGKETTDAAVEIVARRRSFHPVQSYLAALRWDGVPRIDNVLVRYFGADASAYTIQVGSKTMIAAIARAIQPGCKVDTMAILEGTQGIGKSRGVRALAGDQWFADTPLDLESKDAAQCLQGKWIYEIGELHSFNRSETTRIKAFVSSQSDNLRPSYGRRNQDFPRQCIFIGTTNGTEYLTDTTGNRRYWPVKCRAVDVAGLQRDRDQLWAEAHVRYLKGERWWLEGAEVALAEAQQADREAIDPWEQPLAAWLERESRSAFTMADALLGALRLTPPEQTQANATRVGKLLAKLGWRAKKARDPNDPTKYTRVYSREAA
ncbi:MAG TPA: virulence-associated E family protein [Polyangiaceae bacterium]|nr:virulence-associated E family protein [Polyangiaceae bacterium]